MLAEYAPLPLHLVFWVDLAILIPAVLGLVLMPEPVEGAEAQPLRIRPTRPRVSREARSVFIPAVIGGFAGFAVLGLFTALAPAFLGQVLDVPNAAVIGLVVLAVFGASTLGQVGRRALATAPALLIGCALLIVGMALLAISVNVASLALLIAAGAVAGFGQGMAFAAGLASVNEAAAVEDRAATASAYFVVCYLAISFPVIGVGLLARETGLVEAGTIFAVVVATLAVLAMAGIVRLRHR